MMLIIDRILAVAEDKGKVKRQKEVSRSEAERRNAKTWAGLRAAGLRAGGSRDIRMTAKRLGEIAEAAFLAKAVTLGFGVAKPWGDSERYDFIVDAKQRLSRVQVKSAYRLGEDGGYSFRTHGHSLVPYGPKEIDALVAYVVPENAWYVFPVKEVQGLKSLKLYPGSKRKRSQFEKFREAWEGVRGQKSDCRK